MGRKVPVWELGKDTELEAEGIPYMAMLRAGRGQPAQSTLHTYVDLLKHSPVLCVHAACVCQGDPGIKSMQSQWVKDAQQILL